MLSKQFLALVGLLLLIGESAHSIADTSRSNCAETVMARKGIIQADISQFTALEGGLVAASKYNVGDQVDAGLPILNIAGMEFSQAISVYRQRAAETSIRLQELRAVAAVNLVGLESYVPLNTTDALEIRKRIGRVQEIETLQNVLTEVSENIRALNSLHVKAGGTFDFPIVLLSQPPRQSESVKAGSPLFRYAALDRLTVAVDLDSASNTPPREVEFRPNGKCVRLRYVRAEIDSKANIKRAYYIATVKPSLQRFLAEMYLNPQPFVDIYLPSQHAR